jgi:hypothetical protein
MLFLPFLHFNKKKIEAFQISKHYQSEKKNKIRQVIIDHECPIMWYIASYLPSDHE